MIVAANRDAIRIWCLRCCQFPTPFLYLLVFALDILDFSIFCKHSFPLYSLFIVCIDIHSFLDTQCCPSVLKVIEDINYTFSILKLYGVNWFNSVGLKILWVFKLVPLEGWGDLERDGNFHHTILYFNMMYMPAWLNHVYCCFIYI